MKALRFTTVVALFAAFALGAANADEDGPGAGSAKQSTSPTMLVPTLTAKGADDMARAVVNLAIEREQSVTVAIVDSGGNLLLFKRMDGASLGTIQAAIGKAVSALRLQAPTQVFSDMASKNIGLALGFVSSDFTVLGGGQPIRIDGVVVGAIAVSGGAGGEDDLYNNAGLKVVGADIN